MSQPTKKKSAKKAARNAGRKFTNKISEYAKKHSCPANDNMTFKEMLGYGRLCNTLLASDVKVREKSTKFLGEALVRLRNDNPSLTFQFWTILVERGNTSDREPVIDIKYLKSSTDKLFRKLNLDGLYVIESQGLGNHPNKGLGRTIMAHTHAITWTTDSRDFQKIEDELNKTQIVSSPDEPNPVRIKSVIEADSELEYLAYYLFKPPYDVKMLEHRKCGDRLKSTEKGYKPEFAVRMLELLSQLEMKELVRGVGSGKDIRQDWSRRITYWQRSRAYWMQGNLTAYHFDDFWDRYRMMKRRRNYARYEIRR